MFKGLNRYFLGIPRENPVTASHHVDALNQVLLDLKQKNACVLLYPASFHYILFFYWRYNPFWVCTLQPTSGAIAFSLTRFFEHT